MRRMSECSRNQQEKIMMYVGVDVGKSKCRAAIMSFEGKIVKELDFSNDKKGDIKSCFNAFGE